MLISKFVWTDEKVVEFVRMYHAYAGIHKGYDLKKMDLLTKYKEGVNFAVLNKPKTFLYTKDIVEKFLCLHWNTTSEMLVSKNRNHPYITRKKIFQFLLNSYCGLSHVDIANICNYKTWRNGNSVSKGSATVLSNVKSIRNRLETEPAFVYEIAEITEGLKNFKIDI